VAGVHLWKPPALSGTVTGAHFQRTSPPALGAAEKVMDAVSALSPEELAAKGGRYVSTVLQTGAGGGAGGVIGGTGSDQNFVAGGTGGQGWQASM
jgi:hypothetical protein